jgi:hypothetical protein
MYTYSTWNKWNGARKNSDSQISLLLFFLINNNQLLRKTLKLYNFLYKPELETIGLSYSLTYIPAEPR